MKEGPPSLPPLGLGTRVQDTAACLGTQWSQVPGHCGFIHSPVWCRHPGLSLTPCRVEVVGLDDPLQPFPVSYSSFSCSSGAATVSLLHGRSLEMKQGEREAQPSPGAQTGRVPGLKGCLVSSWEQETHGLSWERRREKRVRPEFTSSMGSQAPGGRQEGKRRCPRHLGQP